MTGTAGTASGTDTADAIDTTKEVAAPKAAVWAAVRAATVGDAERAAESRHRKQQAREAIDRHQIKVE